MSLDDQTPSTDLRSTLTAAAAGSGEGLRRGLWVSFLDTYGLEVALGSGVDWLGLDLQHGNLEPSDVPGLLRVAERAGLPLLARTPDHAPATVGRLLDAGVDGLIVPMVESADQARALVSAGRTPPRGTRSTGGCRQTLGVADAPAEQLLLPMVETAAGLRNAADILAVDGVDGVFVGPYDLSISSGFPAPDSPQTLDAVRHVLGLARGAGKVAGFMAGAPGLVDLAPEADLVALDTDVAALRLGLSLIVG